MNTRLLSLPTALHIWSSVHLARSMDEKMAKWVKQNKGGTFQLAATGHELLGVICGTLLIAGKDWSCPYYRDQPFVIGLGAPLIDLMGVFLGREVPHHSGGRMMPYHFSHKELRILCQSSVVASQFLHAVGCAWATKQSGSDEVVYVSAGDGATSQGDFHEALNFAALHRLPILFVIHDNGWAISVPAHEQTAGTIGQMGRGYEGLEVVEVDGGDAPETYRAFQEILTRARRGEGPSLLVARVPRLCAHSNSDDPGKYRTLAANEPDPMVRFRDWLLEQGASSDELDALQQKAKSEIETVASMAEQLPYPPQGSSRLHVFAPSSIESRPSQSEGEKIPIVDALNHALVEEMEENPAIVVFGQDVAHGKGGVFGVTRGLTQRFGPLRCFNTPLAESTIVGIGVGMAMEGRYRPVVEIQFADYLWTGINQLFNEAASIHYRSNGEWSVPMVLRMPCGGYIQGGPYHSQNIEGFLTHCPGLKVVYPSHAADAKRLLKAAMRDPNPVIFLEHKGLYRQSRYCARSEPDREAVLALGEAAVVLDGRDLTVVTYGFLVMWASELAEKLSGEGYSIEVIDLRTLMPWDLPTVLQSVKKTGKVLIAHEACLTGGFGAEIAATLASQAFSYLDAPIQRLGAFDSAVPYSKPLENEMLPQLGDFERSMRLLLRY